MHRMYKYILLLFLFIFGPAVSQAEDDDEKGYKEVTYDCATSKFSSLVPFDRPFVIEFINIPDTIRKIRLGIKAIPKVQKIIEAHPDDTVITDEDLYNYSREPELRITDVQPPGGFKDHKASVLVPFQLLPNKNYYFNIELVTYRQLTEKEKADLTNCLKQNPQLNNFISDLVKARLDNPFGGFEGTSIELKKFNETGQAAVTACNSNYILTDKLEINDQLKKIIALKSAIINIQSKLDTNDRTLTPKAKEVLSNTLIWLKGYKWSEINQEHIIAPLEYYLNDTVGKKAPPTDSKVIEGKIEKVKKEIDTFIELSVELVNDLNAEALRAIVTGTIKQHPLGETYFSDPVENSKLYITGDVGLSYSFFTDKLLLYTGANIYFRPMNHAVPLSQYNDNLCEYLGTHLSFLLGFTTKDMTELGKRKGAFNDKGLVIGVGYQPIPVFKLNGGGLVYRSAPKNPLLAGSGYKTTVSPFVSISVSLKVRDLLEGVGTALFK